MEHSNTTNSDAGTGSGIMDRVRERATAQLSTQKDRATDGLGSVAQAVRQSTQHLRENKQDAIAQYVEKAADQIDRFSTQLRNRDVGELVNEVQRFARRQPALFVGSAFAVGVIGARFLKSSSDNQRHPAHEHYGTSPRGTMDYAGRGI
jgi:ElaB/YqjD/DUF883 family membrane-anchored ribosome-binding protein